jgi:hypothetical protein
MKAQLVGGKNIQYDKVLEEKNLPDYWYRKYQLTLYRWRRYYGIKSRSNTNPMLDVLVERAALMHTKMQYYESPDFETDTGVKIENPLYMGEYDKMVKSMLKTIDQIQKYTEAKPKATSKSVSLDLKSTVKELEKLKDAELDNEIRSLIGGTETEIESSVEGEEEETEISG